MEAKPIVGCFDGVRDRNTSKEINDESKDSFEGGIQVSDEVGRDGDQIDD